METTPIGGGSPCLFWNHNMECKQIRWRSTPRRSYRTKVLLYGHDEVLPPQLSLSSQKVNDQRGHLAISIMWSTTGFFKEARGSTEELQGRLRSPQTQTTFSKR
eukprot:SAG11_NODE_1574_length_4659_cov_4.583333_9_plen_104_part_00